MDRSDDATSGGFGGSHNNGAGGVSVVFALDIESTVHELGHAFGLWHDARPSADKTVESNSVTSGLSTEMIRTYCAAKLLSVSQYFGGSGSSSGSTTINMLTPLRSPPDSVKLRFEISDTDGLNQAQLLISSSEGVIACKALSGESETVEYILTNAVATRVNSNGGVLLYVSDDTGYFTNMGFTLDLTELLAPPEEISIPDTGLAALIRQKLGLASDAKITQNDMLELISFSPSAETTITDLTGLEYALNMAIFRPSSINVSDLSPLSGLTKLSGLNLRSSQISDISQLANLTNLWQLSLYSNQISDITAISGLTRLTELSLSSNQISNINPLSGLTNLQRLRIFHNQISDLSPLSGLTTLQELHISSNNISDVSPLANLTNLTHLDLSRNQITDVSSLTGLTNLVELSLWVNPITDRSPLETLKSQNPSLTINIESVTIVNRSPEFTEGSSATRSVFEGTGADVKIGSPLSATDADNDTLIYSLSGTDAGSFVINTGTGQLKTKVGVELDFETKSTYTVTVTVTDTEGSTDTITVNINIQDVNETADNNPPIFGDGSTTSRSIDENAVVGANIGSPITATDPDSGDTLTYSLSGTDAATFDIDNSTGQLRTKATLDYDTKNTYTVEVSVSDGKGGSASITVTINVTQAGEDQSIIDDTPIEETTPETETTITPSDSSTAGQITFSELMFATRGGLHSLAQWMELYNNSDTNAVNLTGWKLEIEARDKNGAHRHAVIPLEALHIPANQTALIVTWNAQRKSEGFSDDRVYRFFNHHSDEFEQNTHRNMVLGFEGFFLKLSDPDGVVVDVVGNLDGDPTTADEPAWEIPSGTTENGARTSLLRRYDKDTRIPLDGTGLDSWRSSSKFQLLVTRYWGSITDIGNPGYRGGGAVPVTLSHFRAEHTNAGVVLKWTTQSEVDNAGFYILRSETKDGEFAVVNPAMIQGAGTTGERNEYTWTDSTAKPNTVYYYQIEDVSHAGVHKQLATVRLKELVSASGKLTTRWADLKM